MQRNISYKWEAEKKDGEIVTEGGDLTGCTRFSAIPEKDGLPRHDFIGKKFKNRFNLGFKQTPLFGYEGMLLKLEGKLKENEKKLIELAEINRDKVYEKFKQVKKDQPENIALHNLLRSKTTDADKNIKSVVSAIYSIHYPSEHYYLCAVYQGGRFYVNAYTGAVLCTPEKYELYI